MSAFSGSSPHFGLWKYFFEVVPRLKGGKIPACGGAVIQPRPNSGYFDLANSLETKAWEWRWFYAPDLPGHHTVVGMPRFTNEPCWQKPEWGSLSEPSLETMKLVEAVLQLLE